ncbi:MAG TPA: hypothetical protein PK665_09415 [Ignavibacteriaceae bacterium]|jgi:hypothetical protein|nr:hypothetical protein [Ignavibacteriaceae bacterium]
MNNSSKRLTPEKKLMLSLNLYYSAKELKANALKALYPKLSDKEIKEKVRKFFLYARS